MTEAERMATADPDEMLVFLEGRVSELTKLLEDPELYTSREGTARSLVAGKELEDVKRKLDAAIERWTNLTERAEKLAVR